MHCVSSVAANTQVSNSHLVLFDEALAAVIGRRADEDIVEDNRNACLFCRSDRQL